MGTPHRKRGRPAREVDVRRDRRVVTFVTGSEYARLQQLALQEDRSLSFIVHRLIASQLEDLK